MKKACLVCDGEYQIKPSHAAKSRFCSRPCYAAYLRIAQRTSGNPNWKGGKKYRKCDWCHCSYGVIRAKFKGSKFCSRRCQAIVQSYLPRRYKRPGTQILTMCRSYRLRLLRGSKPHRRCLNCGQKPPKGRSYCINCRLARKTVVPCVSCGVSMVMYASQIGKKTTCSAKCSRRQRTVRQLGKLSHRYIDGRTPLKRKIRNLAMMKEWKAAVFARDDYTCQKCGQRGGRLTAHHIVTFSKIVREHNISSLIEAIRCSALWDLPNGLTLCKPCHKQTHSDLNTHKTRVSIYARRT